MCDISNVLVLWTLIWKLSVFMPFFSVKLASLTFSHGSTWSNRTAPTTVGKACVLSACVSAWRWEKGLVHTDTVKDIQTHETEDSKGGLTGWRYQTQEESDTERLCIFIKVHQKYKKSSESNTMNMANVWEQCSTESSHLTTFSFYPPCRKYCIRNRG